MIKVIKFGLLILLSLLISVPAVWAKDDSDSVSLQLSWNHQFQFAGYYAAVEKGFYRDVGLEVELIEGGPGTHCNEKMLQKIDFCNSSGSIVKQWVDGEKVVVLASIMQHSPIVLITRKDSDLNTPHDLIGKKVEMLLSGKPVPEIQAMFQGEGVKMSQLIPMENTASIGRLLMKEVDAIYGFSSNEPFQLSKAGIDYKIIHPRRYGVDFYGDVLVTSEKQLENAPLRVKKFLNASLQGWRYAMNHQQEIADLIIKKYSYVRPRKDLLAEAKVIEKLMLPELIEIGRSNPGRWRHTAETLASMKLIDDDFSLEGFVYQPDKQTNYLAIIRFLITGIVLMTVVMGVLWFFNYRLSQEINRRKKAQERLRQAKESADRKAYTDDLSGLGNRRAVYERGVDAINLAKNQRLPLSLIIMDLDHFKKVNDQFGHLVGDRIIRSVAQIILRLVRSSHIQGRIGGEEFAILLPDTELKGALELAESVRHEVANISVVENEKLVSITASFGVTALSDPNDDINSLVKRCDDALYNAKNQGRNRVVSL